jgi:DNA-binding MarR family transcriptional regulator
VDRKQLFPGGAQHPRGAPQTPLGSVGAPQTPLARTPRSLFDGKAKVSDRHPANDAWEALLTAHASLIRQFAAEDIWEDCSMKEYDVLYTLSKCQEPIRLSELNRHVLLSQPALSRLVDRLADRGLVGRGTDPRDARGVRLALTEEGKAVQRRIGRRHARSVAQAMLSELTAVELRQLEEICAKLAKTTARSE